jgi:hypothetical protein
MDVMVEKCVFFSFSLLFPLMLTDVFVVGCRRRFHSKSKSSRILRLRSRKSNRSSRLRTTSTKRFVVFSSLPPSLLWLICSATDRPRVPRPPHRPLSRRPQSPLPRRRLFRLLRPHLLPRNLLRRFPQLKRQERQVLRPRDPPRSQPQTPCRHAPQSLRYSK